MSLGWIKGRKAIGATLDKMHTDDARNYIASLYQTLLSRVPAPRELEPWVQFLMDGNSAEKAYFSFLASDEYKLKSKVSALYPAGHYHSPIVDPSTVGDYVAKERGSATSGVTGIHLPIEEMENFWRRWSVTIAATPFQEASNPKHRYYYNNNIFPYGDAIGLRTMIAELKPRTVIEIGSGFSSACMLDCADEFGLDTKFTFIDPNPERLKHLLRPEDHSKVTIVEALVQEADPRQFESLGAGDILFIDSTHVLKTGSDVHYELFHILPKLPRGVVIHFHDIQYPFEYPDRWIFKDNYSWNEIYALRAFLMYNTGFSIRFWGSCLAHERTAVIRDVFPLFLKNPGGSIWINRN